MAKWTIFQAILKEAFIFAWTNIKNNIFRTILSIFAITVGIFTIISLLTFVNSLDRSVKNSISQLGGGIVYIQKWPWLFDNDYPWWKFVNRPNVTYEEMKILENKLNPKYHVSIVSSIYGKIIKSNDDQFKNASIDFISTNYNKVQEIKIYQGRYFTNFELKNGKSTIILGNEIANSLFPTSEPIGKKVKVLNRKFTVIGVLEKEGNSSITLTQLDKKAFIPYNYGRSLYGSNMKNIDVTIKIKGTEDISEEKLEDEVRGIMRSIRKLKPKEDDNFALNRASFIMDKLNQIFKSLSIVGWIIAGFSILIGGFGTANIMFVSVKERTKIIGIQKALGSKKYFIILQFLGEAIILCLAGGFLGLMLVIIGSFVVNTVQSYLQFYLTIKNAIIGIGLSTSIGILSGLIPAFQASKLDPNEAIRSHF